MPETISPASIANALRDAAATCREDGLVLAVNEAFAAFCGRGRGQIEGRPIAALLDPDNVRVEDMRALESSLGAGSRITAHPVALRDASGIVREMVLSVLHLAPGGSLVTLAAAEPGPRVHAASLATETSYGELVEMLPEVLFEADTTGRITFGNRTAYTLFGLSEGDFRRGLLLIDFVAPEDRERGGEAVRAVLAGERRGGNEYTVVRRDGTRLPVMIHSTPIVREGEIVGIRGIIIDLSQKRRAEQELARREEQLRTLITALPDIVCFKDGEGRWLEANPFDLQLFALEGVDYHGKRDRDLARYSPFYADAFLACEESDEVAWRAGHMVRSEETIPRPEGTPLAFDIIKVPLFNEDGSRRALVVIGRDITERKRFEAQFLQAQRMEAVGRLAGGIAHDFNNLLTGITGYADLAVTLVGRDAPDADCLREIQSAAGRAAELTNQLLAFSRRQIIQPVVVGLNDLVRDLHSLVRRLIGEDVELVIDAAAAPDLVRVDPGQIEQVVLNLVVNARDAMPSGGRLTIATSNTFGEQPDVVLDVVDTGCGMTREVRARLFEPFFTTKEKGRGTGLGLATAWGIVEQSGGVIEVDSAPGQGSRFSVRLPVAAGQPSRRSRQIAAEDVPPGGGETVLVVEDEPVVLHLVRLVLGRQGYHVMHASNGTAALALLDAPNAVMPELLLTDVVLPDMNGREVAEQVTARVPRIKVLFTSGYTDAAIVQDHVLERGIRFLPKPFSATTLLRAVREALGP